MKKQLHLLLAAAFCCLLTSLALSQSGVYYHPFQNFDDDVDRIKTFSNAFGGNAGLIGFGALVLSLDTVETRTGHGRSLKMAFGPLWGFDLYVESFERKWYDKSTWLDLTDLFPDFAGAGFQNRHIDSIVFYGKLVSNEPLVLQVKLEDSNGGGSIVNRNVLPLPGWQRLAFALDAFQGNFQDSLAKFAGLNFDQGLGQNFNNEGVFYLDDLYLVEKNFQKPSFSQPTQLLDYLNEVSFRHFWMAVEPKSKFALDRHVWDDLISVDATGFSLSACVIAHKNGWVAPEKIENRVEHILTYLLDSCRHTNNPGIAAAYPDSFATVKGIWAHFLDHQTLSRKDEGSEYHLFSTALLLAGVLAAGEYFHWNDLIVSKADALYAMTDWNFLRRPGGLMAYWWTPEIGYSPAQSDWFNEAFDLAFLLGISSPLPAHRLPANPFFLDAYRKPLCTDSAYVYSASGSNFSYWFLQMYARYGGATGRFQNAKNALLADLDFCQNEYAALGYDPRIFGTTACEGPDSAGVSVAGTDTAFISNYHAYGYCCKFDQGNAGNGTVALYGSGAAALFLPEETKALWNYYYQDLDQFFWDEYACRFWSPIFGMPDAFHLDPDAAADTLLSGLGFRSAWLSVPRFGIDVGPMLMNTDSYLSELAGAPSLRDYFSSHPLLAANLAQFAEIPPTGALTPTVAIAADAPGVCEGGGIALTATPQHGGVAPVFQWFIDGSLAQTGGDPTFFLQKNAGSYAVFCAMISSEHCIEGMVATSGVLTLAVFPLPMPVSISNSPICAGETLTLSASGGATYAWSGPGNFTAAAATLNLPNVSLAMQGVYFVTATDQNGCTATASQFVTVHPNPGAVILPNGSTVFCQGGLVELAASGGTNYAWSNEATTAAIVAMAGGIYTVTVTDANGCTATASQSVTVNLNPQAVITPGGATVFCQGDSVALTASGGNEYLWSTTVTTATIGAIATGTYTVTATNAQDCTASASIEVTVHDLPAVTLSAFADVCLDTPPFALGGGNPTGGIYEGSGVDGNLFSPAPAGEGSHALTYTYTDVATGCSNFATQNIVVHPLPSVSLAPLPAVCVQSPAFDLTGGMPAGGIYEGAGVANGMFHPAAVGIGVHVVTYIYTDNLTGCDASAAAEIEVDSSILPTILVVASDTGICEGDTLLFEAASFGGGLSPAYEWFVNGLPVGENSPVFSSGSLQNGDEVTCKLTSSETCALPNAVTGVPVVVTVHGLPEVSLIFLMNSVEVTAAPFPLSGGDPPGGFYSGEGVTDGIFYPDSAGLGGHEITYVFTDANGCSDSASAGIFVVPVTGTFGGISGKAEIVIFPNPSFGLVTLFSEGLEGFFNLTVFDVHGLALRGQEINLTRSDAHLLDFRHLPPGVYLIALEQNGGCVATRMAVVF